MLDIWRLEGISQTIAMETSRHEELSEPLTTARAIA
jgi:hypothetical protein